MVQSVAQMLTAADFVFGFDWLYTFAFYQALVAWEAEAIVDYLWEATDLTPFDIFSELRSEVLNNREDWVCGIYNAADSGEVESFLVGAANTYITGTAYSTEVKAWAVGIFQDMLSQYWLNLPFVHYDNIAGYSDDGAIQCAVTCSDYQYLVGTASSSPAVTNPDDGEGQDDGVPTNAIDTPGTWYLTLDTPITITADMVLEINTWLVAGSYCNYRFHITTDVGGPYTFRSLNTIRVTGWEGGSIGDHAGESLLSLDVFVDDPGPGQDPDFVVDGVRLSGGV